MQILPSRQIQLVALSRARVQGVHSGDAGAFSGRDAGGGCGGEGVGRGRETGFLWWAALALLGGRRRRIR